MDPLPVPPASFPRVKSAAAVINSPIDDRMKNPVE
jgi:hypothetical protein